MLQFQLDSLIGQYGLSDLAIAINQHGTEPFSAGYGHCDVARTQLINADTLFGVASITKLITAITLLRLQERGQLTLQDSVKKYYPTLKAASNPNLKLHHLLSHSSGWPGIGSRFHAMNLSAPDDLSGGIANNRGGDHSSSTRLHNTDDLVEFMNHQKIKSLAAPGQLLNYSNEGFCLLGGVVELITGCSWQHTIEQEILRPLKMLNSTTGIPDSSRFKSIAQPIILSNTQRSAAGIWDAPLFYPAGGVVASAHDLLHLMTVLSPDGPLLEPASRTQLLTPARTIASRPLHRFGYSLGLEYRQFRSGHDMHWHTGQRAGLSAFVATIPSSGLSLALLSNSSDAPLTAIAHKLLAHLIDHCNDEWPPAASQPTIESIDLDLCGHYASDEGFSYLITKSDDGFYLQHDTETTKQALRFTTATSGYVGQLTFAFLTEADTFSNATKPHNNRPFNNKPWALALDLRVLPRIH